MDKSDRIYFSNFAADPEFESIYEYDDLYDFDFDGNPDQSRENIKIDDSDEFLWDDL
jgi:hypothetical protein